MEIVYFARGIRNKMTMEMESILLGKDICLPLTDATHSLTHTHIVSSKELREMTKSIVIQMLGVGHAVSHKINESCTLAKHLYRNESERR